MKALTLEILMSINYSSLFLSNPHILWSTTVFFCLCKLLNSVLCLYRICKPETGIHMDEGDNLQDLVPFPRSFCEVMTMQRLDSILMYISFCYQTYCP